MRSHVGVALLMATLAVSLSGCGDAGSSLTIRGKVTLNDEPVGGADIQYFIPQETQINAFHGKSKDDGTYEIVVPATVKTPPGAYRVTVVKYEPKKDGKSKVNTEGMDTTQLKMMGLAVNVLPGVYENAQSTPLTVEVKPGQVTGDLKLSGAAKK
ncbi:hypothetical protein [Zavarzinella formosa]|uniref:hypothetical protein n=1 Tax=Zavarzinella formosa TaxID=360055 RepID=UPI0012F72358|nr:hypothetical protein [Zavarzinella formosa]